MRPWTTPLRVWQQEALPIIRQAAPDCLVMATPGAGKTTLALKVIHEHLSRGAADRAVVVCHTDHLREQWTRAAGAVGIHLDPALSTERTMEAADYHGAVVTYQQVALAPQALAQGCVRRRTLAVFDELHHAADGQEWGTGLREAFGLATRSGPSAGIGGRRED